MITVKKYKRLNKEFKQLYRVSFPKDERLPYFFLSSLIKVKQGELAHYYDNEIFVGFTLSFRFKKYTCLAFFATDPKLRNQGYGKQILDIYFKENEEQIIFLNCEVPENMNKENIKYRRLMFYKRNDFVITPLIMSYKNIDYLTLVNKKISDSEVNELYELLVRFGCTCRIDETLPTVVDNL